MHSAPILIPANEADENPPVAEPPLLPASSGQRRLWFLDQMERGRPLYNVPQLVRLRGRLEERALDRALAAIMQRHEVLRTSFVAVGTEPMQIVATSWMLELPLTDLEAVEPGRREAELHRLADEEARRPFDLAQGPMLRARLFRLGPTEHALMLVLHHIASDGWSMAVLYRELGESYAACARGAEARLPELRVQYADFAAWQGDGLRGMALDRLLGFWKQQLAGAPAVLELPTDRARPPVQSHRGAIVSERFSPRLLADLTAFSVRRRATLFMTLLAAFNVVLQRHSGQDDIVVGSPQAGRDEAETENLIGFFINTLALRTNLAGDPTFTELLDRVRDVTLAAFEHRELPFEKLVGELQPERNLSFEPVCQVIFALQNMPVAPLTMPGLEVAIEPVHTGTAKTDLSVWASEEEGGLLVTAEYATDLFEAGTMRRWLGHFRTVLESIVVDADRPLSQLPLLTRAERQQLETAWNATHTDYDREKTVAELFAAQCARTPAAVALVFEGRELTYAALDARAERLAARLRELGAGADVLVGVCVERSLEMMVGLLGILKSGAAYVPLDPTYPAERLAFMLQDAEAPVLVTQRALLPKLPAHSCAAICVDDEPAGSSPPSVGEGRHGAPASADNLAYVLYTSGSTGNPKGVMVTHRNVVNFFAGMDRVLGTEPGVWLAVTSISFDISVLELCWTLTRGYKVVILSDRARLGDAGAPRRGREGRAVDLSLFYFASDDASNQGEKYRLLLEGAKFADTHGFGAVWTPERHFHSFGGLYPNPAVTSAAIAAVTQRVQIRAGSVVLPLHDPLRVAEEWSVVDNLSGGRVALSFATGWHDRDFALAPQNYATRKDVMREGIDIVRRLWRGEERRVTGGRGGELTVKIFPRPVQRELPVWVTTAGNVETFRLAGELGANVLTHLLGQDAAALEEKIRAYRAARAQHGFDEGCVTVALHTFVGDDAAAVRQKVRGPFCRYLIESLDLLKALSESLFPGVRYDRLTAPEQQLLAEHAFERFFGVNALFGTPETCGRVVENLGRIGVDEVACLIDFGVDTDSALAALAPLARVREECQRQPEPAGEDYSLAAQLARHGVTHLQCTPSFARLLAAAPDSWRALRPLRKLLVGGEALPAGLADELARGTDGDVINMYGPTETTIWSTTHRVSRDEEHTGTAAIGRPVANTQVYLCDPRLRAVPIGVPGELYLGGDGVARGYWRRPELTAEKFLANPFRPGERIYRTGDLARYRSDGTIEFLGRTDHQVKLRGHRIELGEIEAALGRHPAVRHCVVVLRAEPPGEPRLVAYLVAGEKAPPVAEELKDFLRRGLPAQMVPEVFVPVARLPLTPNGKVDRKALPAPQTERPPAAAAFAAPAAGLEQTIAAVWKDVLAIDQPGADDNFFEFGGHSLQVVQVQGRLREALGVELPVIKLFQHPTIRSLARHLAGETTDGDFQQKIADRARRGRAAPIHRRPNGAGVHA